jgi:hypothetical protein
MKVRKIGRLLKAIVLAVIVTLPMFFCNLVNPLVEKVKTDPVDTTWFKVDTTQYDFIPKRYFIPIVEGNTWVYEYHKIHDYFSKDTTDGIYQMSINTAVNQNDSIFFTLSTAASGVVHYQDTTKHDSTYNNHFVNEYLLVNSVLFFKDSNGTWSKDTSPPWYLSYMVQKDTSYLSEPGSRQTYSYCRHTDSTNIAIDNVNYLRYRCEIRDTLSQVSPGWVITKRRNIAQWIKNFGSLYVRQYYSSYGPVVFLTISDEEWTLVSFNSIPLNYIPNQ